MTDDARFAPRYSSLENGPAVRTCISCGCTDARACAGGCSWWTVNPAVCTNCIPPDEKAELERHEAAVAGLPRYIAEMDPVEAAFTEAIHDLGCGSLWGAPSGPAAPDHGLADHEPFDVEEEDIVWAKYTAALAGRGLVIIEVEKLDAIATDVESWLGTTTPSHIVIERVAKPIRALLPHRHVWVSAKNEAVQSGEMCALGCGAVRAGPDTELEQDISAQVGQRVVRLAR